MRARAGFTATALLLLGLTGCSPAAPDADPSSSTAATSTTATQRTTLPVSLGETVELTRDDRGERLVRLTINDISVATQCHHGVSTTAAPTDIGGFYLQVTGEMEVVESSQEFLLSDSSFIGTDADGYAVQLTTAASCNAPGEAMEGFQAFDAPIQVGQKARGVLELWAPTMPATLTLAETEEPTLFVWDIPDTITSVDVAPTPTPQAPAPAPTPTPPPVIGMTGAPGVDTPQVLNKTIASCGDPGIHETGTTFFTDGTTGWTEQCAQQMSG